MSTTSGTYSSLIPLSTLSSTLTAANSSAVVKSTISSSSFSTHKVSSANITAATSSLDVDSPPLILTSSLDPNLGLSNASRSYLESCNSASNWFNGATRFVTNSDLVTITESSTSWTYSTPTDVIPYTTISGIPRAHGTFRYYLATSLATLSFWNYTTIDRNPAQPKCTIDSKGCAWLSTSWSIADDSAYSAFWATASSSADRSDRQSPPPCVVSGRAGGSRPYDCKSGAFTNMIETVSGQIYTYSCALDGGPLQMAFWPVTNQASKTIPAHATITPEARIFGTTLRSPGVLLSIATLFARDACGNTIGEPVKDYVFLQQTSDIRSQCGAGPENQAARKGIPSNGTQVNFADFNLPYPVSAYKCQPACKGQSNGSVFDACSTFYDNMEPNLAFPTAIWSIRPEWSSCHVPDGLNVLSDPPIAVTAVSNILSITTSQPITTTTPAAPASTTQRLPVITSIAKATTSSAAIREQASNAPESSSQNDVLGGIIASVLGILRPTATLVEPSSVASTAVQSIPQTDAVPGSAQSQVVQAASAIVQPILSIINPVRSKAPAISLASGQSSEKTTIETQAIIGGGTIKSLIVETQAIIGGGTIKSLIVETHFLNAGSTVQAQVPAAAVITAGSATISAFASSGVVVISGSTLTQGQKATINGQAVSFAGDEMVVGGTTVPFSKVNAQTKVNSANPTDTAVGKNGIILTIGSSTITAVAGASGGVSIAGSVLSAGQTTVINGQTISAGSTALVIGSSTIPLSRLVIATAGVSAVLRTSISSTSQSQSSKTSSVSSAAPSNSDGGLAKSSGHISVSAHADVIWLGLALSGFMAAI